MKMGGFEKILPTNRHLIKATSKWEIVWNEGFFSFWQLHTKQTIHLKG